MRFLIALAVTLTSAPALAAETKSDPADKREARKICKRELTGTGLHASRRVCLTAAEWKERNRNADTVVDGRSKQSSY
jgi:hypothetical protein